MIICNNNTLASLPAHLPKLIGGHLYKHEGSIYIYARQDGMLINIVDGARWSHDGGYGMIYLFDSWEDVTDKYCLKEI